MTSDFPILRFFEHSHLPTDLAAVSKPFCDLAHEIAKIPSGDYIAEKIVALRKLLESKDAAVRAALSARS